jgi:predicted MFS family arabinose efflux permease
MTVSEATKHPSTQAASRSFIWLAAIAVGVIVTNLFAPQILVGLIGPSLGMTAQQAGMISTVTLLGYALGLFLLVPLADLFENKRLILRTLWCAGFAALCTAVAPTPVLLLGATFILGGCCAAGPAGGVDGSAAPSRTGNWRGHERLDDRDTAVAPAG